MVLQVVSNVSILIELPDANLAVILDCSAVFLAFLISISLVFSSSADMASAWIKYVTSVEGETIWCSGAGCLPPRSDAATAMDVESDPVWKVHAEMTAYSIPEQLGNNYSIINDAYRNYLPLAVSGEMSAAEFLAAAETQANQEIANAG